MNTLVFTCGDINGIGPEICIKSINQLQQKNNSNIVFICPSNVFESTAELVPPLFKYKIVKKFPAKLENQEITILDIGHFKQKYGESTADSGNLAFLAIKQAYRIITGRSNSAMITAPISKAAFKLAGVNFPGHTELLASLCRTKKYSMVFLSDNLVCALATIHEPIKNVPKLLTKKSVKDSIFVLLNSLTNDLGIANPRIAILGLNPHAGEEGNIGKEEIITIAPTVRSLKNNKIAGPFVPDAFFGNQLYKKYDAVLGMYHDQVLIPFKLLNFNNGVNYTAGLKIIRTSPDHGTGYDIAGKGIANPQSMIEAVKWAKKIIENRQKNNNES